MQPIIESLREILGTPNFYLESGVIDYGAVLEYSVASILLLLVVGSLFFILRSWLRKR